MTASSLPPLDLVVGSSAVDSTRHLQEAGDALIAIGLNQAGDNEVLVGFDQLINSCIRIRTQLVCCRVS